MTYWNTALIMIVAAAFAGLWIYDRWCMMRDAPHGDRAGGNLAGPLAVLRFDLRTGNYRPHIPAPY